MNKTEYGRLRFILRETETYYIDDNNKEHKIVNVAICANGPRDLCIAKKSLKPHHINVMKIANVKNKKDIVYVPKGDICWIRIKPPLSNNRHALIIDLGIADSKLKEMIKELFRRFGSIESKDYAMYGGKRYDE